MFDRTERDAKIRRLTDEFDGIVEKIDNSQPRWSQQLRHNLVSRHRNKHHDALNATKQPRVFNHMVVGCITLSCSIYCVIWGIFCHLR